MLEVGLAAGAVGYAYGGMWFPIGVGVAVLCASFALLSLGGRGIDRIVASWVAMRFRRAGVRGQGISSLTRDEYDVITVPPGSRGVTMGAVREGTLWSVPLELPLLDVLNEDPALPLDGLASLLSIEGVPLASVRLVTLTSPSRVPSNPAAGPLGPMSRLATRYLVLTLDTLAAADIIAERGGDAAVPQILRRLVLRAEDVLSAANVPSRRMSRSAVLSHGDSCLGPVTPGPDGAVPPIDEEFAQVEIGGAVSMTVTLVGPDVLAKLDPITAGLGVPVLATSVVIRPGPPPLRTPTVTILLRLTGSASELQAAERQLDALTDQLGLSSHRYLGEQAPLLKATTLLGVTAVPA